MATTPEGITRYGRVGEPFNVVRTSMNACPAYRSLDVWARALLADMIALHDVNEENNGHIGMSQRQVMTAISCSKAVAVRSLRMLQERGFIRLTWKGRIVKDAQKLSSTWQLTMFHTVDEAMNPVAPSFLYLKWKPQEAPEQSPAAASIASDVPTVQEAGYAPGRRRRSRAKPREKSRITVMHEAISQDMIDASYEEDRYPVPNHRENVHEFIDEDIPF